MKRILAILLLPLLLVLPIGDVSRTYLGSQSCQKGPNALMDSCGCAALNQMAFFQVNSCCCLKPDNNSKENISLLASAKIIKINLVSDFEITKPYDLAKKLNIIVNYPEYYAAGISATNEFAFFYPPIYRQICSLRI